MPELITTGAPLYLLLDDISGVALVSSWAWANWDPDWSETMRQRMPADQLEKMTKAREGVCWGLQPGNSGTQFDRPPGSIGNADAGELRNPADPEGWHDFPRSTARASAARAASTSPVTRRPASSASTPPSRTARHGRADGRAAIHEYRLSATADAETLEILMLDPEARILPFWRMPGRDHTTPSG